MNLYVDLSSIKLVKLATFSGPRVVMNPRLPADCERFKEMTLRLRDLQLAGDDLAGRVLWVLSRGTRFMGIDVGRKLLTSWSVD